MAQEFGAFLDDDLYPECIFDGAIDAEDCARGVAELPIASGRCPALPGAVRVIGDVLSRAGATVVSSDRGGDAHGVASHEGNGILLAQGQVPLLRKRHAASNSALAETRHCPNGQAPDEFKAVGAIFGHFKGTGRNRKSKPKLISSRAALSAISTVTLFVPTPLLMGQ